MRFTLTLLSALVVAAVTSSLVAADFKLRAECKVEGSVVRVNDVAEVITSNLQQAERLGQIELFPAPAAGSKRYVRIRELQDVLIARGVNLTEHQFSGAALTTVFAAAGDRLPKPAIVRKLPSLAIKTATGKTNDAIVRNLRANAGDEPWRAEVALSDAQVRAIATAIEVQATGGMRPWIGEQTFKLAFESPEGPVEMNVKAKISLPNAVVVMARPLPRGAMIRADDVQLQRLRTPANDDMLSSVSDVVGKELVRAANAGQPVENAWLHSPTMVKKGDLVTVHARAAGIEVRTTGRAREDGAKGELVSIESAADKSAFFARVSGPQEVEVLAHATTAK